MIHWTRHHHVTGDMKNSTVKGDGNIHIWLDGDPATDQSDIEVSEPDSGFTWRTSLDGWEQYPDPMVDALPDSHDGDTIERVPVGDTTLVG